MRKLFAVTSSVLVVSTLVFQGCGGGPTQPNPTDSAVERALQRLPSGELIEEMNRSREGGKGTWGRSGAEHASHENEGPAAPEDAAALTDSSPGTQATVTDPCPEVGAPTAAAQE